MERPLPPLSTDPHLTDPPLLKNHSALKTYKTSHAEYKDIRVFYREHAKAEELYKSIGPLPLLVCIPGLGGSVAQFDPLLNSLVDLAPCLAIDYPGGGRSGFNTTSWDAYSFEALGELFETIIEDYRDKDAGQTVVLLGHSMGTAHAARLANREVAHVTRLAEYVVGLIAICPASPVSEVLANRVRWFLWVPGWIFDLWRAWDGMGGPESGSVRRLVGPDAEPELKAMQYRYNKQSRTPVWRRTLNGALPTYKEGKPVGGMASLDVWAGLNIPVFVIAGDKDTLTPPSEVEKIFQAVKLGLKDAGSEAAGTDALGAVSAAPVDISTRLEDHLPETIEDIRESDFYKTKEPQTESQDDDPSTPQETPADVPPQPRHPRKVVKYIVMPEATHAVLYVPKSVRALAGLVSDFLATNVTKRLSLAWQLQYLSREGKWDVKNLNKWKKVAPVSEPIGPAGKPIFRAMKTLREADDVHTPTEFVSHWGHIIKNVVDISKDQPVYDPRGLERAGVHYRKFPTVSKVPPTAEEVEQFIQLIDTIRSRQPENNEGEKELIGVHCHYGFNRTGYFIVCYLVERCDFSVKDAIAEFATNRPHGIRHSHFLDRLYVRYSVEAVQKD
jgi:pimeloyl-ACP methyl ester carboxylesterase/protein-tyrosine phosphatase